MPFGKGDFFRDAYDGVILAAENGFYDFPNASPIITAAAILKSGGVKTFRLRFTIFYNL